VLEYFHSTHGARKGLGGHRVDDRETPATLRGVPLVDVAQTASSPGTIAAPMLGSDSRHHDSGQSVVASSSRASVDARPSKTCVTALRDPQARCFDGRSHLDAIHQVGVHEVKIARH